MVYILFKCQVIRRLQKTHELLLNYIIDNTNRHGASV